MIAVIKLGGKQHVVKSGDVLRVEKLSGEKGKTFTLEPLLLADNDKCEIGMPMAKGKITIEITEPEVKGEKIRITKFIPKNRHKRTVGHRQRFTMVKIKEIA